MTDQKPTRPGAQDYPLHSEKTIGDYFRDQVAIDPDHEFVVYPDRDLRWTYAEFDERTDNLAKGLLAIGMKPGDHLGVWARNISRLAHLHVRDCEDRRRHGHGESRLQKP